MSQTSKRGGNNLDKKHLFNESHVIVGPFCGCWTAAAAGKNVIICRDILFNWFGLQLLDWSLKRQLNICQVIWGMISQNIPCHVTFIVDFIAMTWWRPSVSRRTGFLLLEYFHQRWQISGLTGSTLDPRTQKRATSLHMWNGTIFLFWLWFLTLILSIVSHQVVESNEKQVLSQFNSSRIRETWSVPSRCKISLLYDNLE